MDRNYLKDRFLAFAETECKENSALYYKLSIQTANAPELLNIAANAGKGQPVTEYLFRGSPLPALKKAN